MPMRRNFLMRRKACCDGRFSSRCAGMRSDLQRAKYLPLSVQREYPEKLVQGRERIYFEYFWNVLAADKTHSIPEPDREAYTEAYSKPRRMHAAWMYFASWPQLAKDFAQLSQRKLPMPVLAIGGEKSLGNELGAQMKLVADNVDVIVLPNTGHWILEERPKETTEALVKFL